jgi:uncharacterized protein YndB with AHSA1/START domain
MRPRILQAGPDRIRLSAELVGRAPADAFQYWVDPSRLCLWWPPEAKVDLRVDGEYEFAWPRLGQTLKGRWIRIDPGAALEFSWTWEHEPEVTKRVAVTFRPTGSGTEVEVEHGPYSADRRDVELRQEHLDGWTYFLGRLAGTSVAPSGPASA